MKKLRIGIDALPLTMQRTGVTNYIFYLLEELLILLPDCEFYLYAHVRSGDLEYFARYPHVTICTEARLSQSLSIWVQTTLAHFLYRDRIDVFWATSQAYPLLNRKQMKVLFTIYDFVYLLYPETMTTIKRFAHKLLTPALLKRADFILPISHGTAKRLKGYYGCDHDIVIEPPIKPWLKPIESAILEPWLLEKNLAYKEYFLAIGTIEPRKNFEEILTLYASVIDAHDPAKVLPLVVMGGDGWKASRVKVLLAELNRKYPQNVLAIGYASEEDQWRYLSGARFLLMMSHYEGYGMPIAEARVCGTDIICTDDLEMREAAQECGTFIGKEDIREKLAPLFLDIPAPCVDQGKKTYPSNREKAARMAAIVSSLSTTK